MLRTHVTALPMLVLAGAVVALTLFAARAGAQAKNTESVLYGFCRQQGCADGAYPAASLLADKMGDLYGTTSEGGAGGCTGGCGTVFKITAGGTETVLYSFSGGDDGADPRAVLIADKKGNFYGTTYGGGIPECGIDGSSGCGLVFKLSPNGTEKVLHSFAGGNNDGNFPLAGLVPDENGNYYGTTQAGGAYAGGTAFKLAPHGMETVLHAFGSGSDGLYPEATLIADKGGNLYGTTSIGGSGSCSGYYGPGCGTVFKLAPDGSETVLYSFQGGSDGEEPNAALIADGNGNLYGTTFIGGGTGCGGFGCGTVFEITSGGAEMVLYSFPGGNDGESPAGLVADKKGNFYGTTVSGGAYGLGTAFRLAPGGTETVLHSFGYGVDGATPLPLIEGGKGDFYGTTYSGGGGDCGEGYGCGTVFKLKE